MGVIKTVFKFVKDNKVLILSIFITSLFIFSIPVVLMIRLIGNGHNLFDYPLDMEVTGQIGDFISGVLGTITSVGAFLFLYYTFYDQKKEFRKDRFENKYFELLKIHRENVNELSYFRDEELSENRKVFKEIFTEFAICKLELLKIIKTLDNELIIPIYMKNLKKLKNSTGNDLDLQDLVVTDIAYSIVYFGVGKEGCAILKKRFSSRYDGESYNRIIDYFKLKPQGKYRRHSYYWEDVQNYESFNLKLLSDVIKDFRNNEIKESQIEPNFQFVLDYDGVIKFYGGHQHRLGHYFRHLYQTFTYLNSSNIINGEEKYFYGKTLRGQLSTYEQALLYINSITSLGMKWEIAINNIDQKLISKYQIIKNMPSGGNFNLNQKRNYPNVKFEEDEI